jgi:hypothetical protein
VWWGSDLGWHGRREAHQEIGTQRCDSGGEARWQWRGTGSGAAGSGFGEHQGDARILEEVAARPEVTADMLSTRPGGRRMSKENGSGRAPPRPSSSRHWLGQSGQWSMCGTWWLGTHGSLGLMVSSEDSSGGSTSSAIGVGGLLRRAWSRGEEIRRQQERA